MNDLQTAVDRLLAFWKQEGCVRLPSYERPIPAALMHPDVFFALLDPEPCRFTWIQPVRRPLDGRGGAHPTRLSRHHQLQAVLREPPLDVRERVIAALVESGIGIREHEIRFEDRLWEAHSLGASGAGWDVLVDGLRVGRATWIDRLAEQELRPAAVEVSFGVERLLLAATDVEHVFDLDVAPGGPNYGRLRRRSEAEQSRYAVDAAEPQRLRALLDAYEEEAQRSLNEGLLWIAYESALSALPAIDLLEMRGAISLRERQEHLERVRAIIVAAAHLSRARQAAEAITAELSAPETSSEEMPEEAPEAGASTEDSAPPEADLSEDETSEGDPPDVAPSAGDPQEPPTTREEPDHE